jgi:hypothetical protein
MEYKLFCIKLFFLSPKFGHTEIVLKDTENYFLSVSEHETTFDVDAHSPLMTSRTGATTDRATSPSMASVTSGHSAASSVGGPAGVRRLLEWDSGADLVNVCLRSGTIFPKYRNLVFKLL